MNEINIKYRHAKKVIAHTQNYTSAMGSTLYRCSIMLHNLVIENLSSMNLVLQRVELSFLWNDCVLQTSYIDQESLGEMFLLGHNSLSRPPLNKLASSDEFFPDSVDDSHKIGANSQAFIPRIYVECFNQHIPDTLQLKVFAQNSSSSLILNIDSYKNKNDLLLPMDGPLAMIADQEELWGHRTMLAPEFGMDFIVLDQSLQERSNLDSVNKDHYCFSSPVYSCAAGVVHSSADGLPDNPKPFHPSKTFEQIANYRGKVSDLQLGGGNFVLIDHGNEEYILYAHLKLDSVLVKAGDKVEAGQKIAKCGNSGAGSLTPHLHLQMMNHPMTDQAQGLPMRFGDMDNTIFSNELLKSLGMPESLRSLVSHSKALLVKKA
ncbi:MAG: M23 family metallopeptidase [Candidatus Cloacimonetes bacterium]|nr:M23 family metallopeptidase [Candidatus Cloacimonadota bacterium]